MNHADALNRMKDVLAAPRRPADAFVRGVMDRVAAERAGAVPGWSRWVMPTLSAGLAAAAVLIVVGVAGLRAEPAGGVPDPLAVGDEDAAPRWHALERADTLDADEVLNLVMEEV